MTKLLKIKILNSNQPGHDITQGYSVVRYATHTKCFRFQRKHLLNARYWCSEYTEHAKHVRLNTNVNVEKAAKPKFIMADQ